MYISIDNFINYIENNEVPNPYYISRFHKDYIRSLSVEDYCKWCKYLAEKKAKRQRLYEELNKDAIRERHRQYNAIYRETHWYEIQRYRELNRDKIAKQRKEYRLKHKDEIRAKEKERYKLNINGYRDRKRAYDKKRKKTRAYRKSAHKYYLKNRELYIARAKKRYYENRKATGKIRQYVKGGKNYGLYHKNYVAKNKEKIKEYMRNYMKKWSANRTEEQKQKRKEYYKNYVEKNREKINEYQKQYKLKKGGE